MQDLFRCWSPVYLGQLYTHAFAFTAGTTHGTVVLERAHCTRVDAVQQGRSTFRYPRLLRKTLCVTRSELRTASLILPARKPSLKSGFKKWMPLGDLMSVPPIFLKKVVFEMARTCCRAPCPTSIRCVTRDTQHEPTCLKICV